MGLITYLVFLLFSCSLAKTGSFTALTYNVAGLLEPLSSATTKRSTATKEISKYINGFDIVHVQEDFNYNDELYNFGNNHTYKTRHTGGMGAGSGLNSLSYFPFHPPQNVRWGNCADFDCMTPKGFTFTEIKIDDGVLLHLYNIHAQAQDYDSALAARRNNFEFLEQFMLKNSKDFPILILGDFNCRYTRGSDTLALQKLLNIGLTDVWIELFRSDFPEPESEALTCEIEEPGDLTSAECEFVDKVFYRSSKYLTLAPVEYIVKNDTFTQGGILSDHVPFFVRFSYSTEANHFMTDSVGGFVGGYPFNDFETVFTGVKISSVTIWSKLRGRVTGLEVKYDDDTTIRHGSRAAKEEKLSLEVDETLNSLRVCKDLSGWRRQTERVFGIQITTSLGRVLVAGTTTSTCQTLEGEQSADFIVGFHGRKGDEIDSLGAIFKVG